MMTPDELCPKCGGDLFGHTNYCPHCSLNLVPMTPKTLPTMPYSEGARAGAEACMSVLSPKDPFFQWLQIYLDHTAALSKRLEAAVRALEIVMGDDSWHLAKTSRDAVEAALAGEEGVYPADAACTKHIGEPWPCPKCAALAGEEK